MRRKQNDEVGSGTRGKEGKEETGKGGGGREEKKRKGRK